MKGDCLEKMKEIPPGSVDMVLTDPPYGTTQNKWDSVIDFGAMWNELKRITKDSAGLCLFGQQPFSSAVVMSAPDLFKYNWVWEKPQGTGHLNAKKYPLKSHEDILVFAKKPHVYYPQFEQGKPYKCQSGRASENYGSQVSVLTENEGIRYPKTVLRYAPERDKLHPTQKPVALLEYLIKTYTLEGETVLDFTMGSGSTGVACKNLNRNFIGIERDDKYFEIAKERIERA